MKQRLTLLLFLCVTIGCSANGHRDTPSRDVSPTRNGPIGMAITPKNFPSHGVADVEEAFSLAHQLADQIPHFPTDILTLPEAVKAVNQILRRPR